MPSRAKTRTRGSNVRSNRTPRTAVAGSSRRVAVGRLLLVVALLAAGVKLVIVQGFEARALSKKADDQLVTRQPIPAERGAIKDTNGRVLAFSSEARRLSATPQRLNREQREARNGDPSKPTGPEKKREIAAYIDKVTHGRVSEREVLDALFSDQRFIYFGDLVEPSVAREIQQRYPQIGAEYRAVRQYPADTVASNILGAANWRADESKIRGLMGLESSMDSRLAGKDGVRVSETALGSNSLIIPGTETLKPAEPGSDVRLTLDSDLQFTLQRKLRAYIDKHKADGGSAVVLDAQTGKVRALANGRSFDPADSSTWDSDSTGNPAVTTPYEPGSVNKVITAAGAIEHGVMKPDTVLRVPDKIKMGGATIGDAWNHPTVPMTFTGVLSKSSNVGTLMTAKKLGKERFADLMDKFGLGSRTGIALPGESQGVVPPRNQWSNTRFANLPIGQGLSMTVLQMAGMYQAIANDGVRVPPRIVDATVEQDGTVHPRKQPDKVRVVGEKTADTVKNMLRGVVQDEPGQRGTAPGAGLTGYQIAAKTGTAQQPDPSCGCYSNSKYWITFAGIVPADNPRYVVGIMLDDPETRTAGPLFHDIAADLTRRYDIPLSSRPAPELTLRVR